MTLIGVRPCSVGRAGGTRRLLLAVVVMLAAALPAAPARAAARAKACPPAAVSWDGGASVLRVSGKVTCTLKNLDGARPAAPLSQVDSAGKVWFLGASLLLENGATLLLHGGSGDVNELRLRSNNSSDPGSFVTISADWGTIELKDTRVTSWDEAAGGPDSEYLTFGRANLQAHSFLDAGGKARESRLDIDHSDIGFLGFEGPQAYGISWKVDGDAPGLYDAVGVYGNVTASHIHDNYFGVFTYGGQDMRFTANEFDHNVNYGIDPHDDSDYLTIEDNYVHDNGRHGIICSQRCNNLAIRRNRVIGNAGHGIMLHRSVVDTVVEDNEVTGNGEGGIALFESHRNTIRGNQIRGNDVGVRVSVGASDNVVENNVIADSLTDGMYFYQGSDVPTEGDGHPRRNHVAGNSFTGNPGYAVRLTDADDNLFEGNTYDGNGGLFLVERATGNTIDDPR